MFNLFYYIILLFSGYFSLFLCVDLAVHPKVLLTVGALLKTKNNSNLRSSIQTKRATLVDMVCSEFLADLRTNRVYPELPRYSSAVGEYLQCCCS